MVVLAPRRPANEPTSLPKPSRYAQGRLPVLAPLYGPAVRCKLDLSKWRVVLRFCIRPLHGAIVLLAIMDTQLLRPVNERLKKIQDPTCTTGKVN